MTGRCEPTSTRAKKYSNVKTVFMAAETTVILAFMVFFHFFLARPLSSLAYSATGNFAASCVVFSVTFLAFLYIAGFPLHVANTFFVEKAFSLSRQTFSSWAKDEAKSATLSLVLSVFCIGFFYAAVFYFPAMWWVVCSLGWILLTVALAILMPVFLLPLFFKYMPVDDRELKDLIGDIAARSGIGPVDVCRIDLSRKTVKANAALVGMGATRKVVLADTLTDNFTREEVGVVAAHEFGHYKYRHVVKLVTFASISTFLGFFILSRLSDHVAGIAGSSGLYDLRVLPVIFFLATVFHTGALPFKNYVSRKLETQADRFALDVTSDAENFISVMDKLGRMNFADRDPSMLKKILIYSHPPINERIRFADEWKTADRAGAGPKP
jgi:STE24 endopeptidase